MAAEGIQKDLAVLERAQQKGGLAVLRAYFRLSGPGWLGSAFTLGAGSMAGSLFLGVIGGYSLLWVQPLAMLLGVVMLGAISYVTLSLEHSPFAAIRTRMNPALAWSWLIGALLCNMAFSLPQYSVSFAAISENLLPGLIEDPESKRTRLIVSVLLLIAVAVLTFGHGGKPRGIRLYEWIVKGMVATIILSFLLVVVRLAMTGRLPWTEIGSGLVPTWSSLVEPGPRFREILATIENPAVRAYWTRRALGMQRECMIGAASSTVAVNMCFLIPFSLLARKWNRAFRGLALFDLGTGTLLPFLLVTGCIVIASASQFHARIHEGIELREDGTMAVAGEIQDEHMRHRLRQSIASLGEAVASRQRAAGLEDIPVEAVEKRIAAMLLPRDNYELAGSLAGLSSYPAVVQKIFGIGVLAMTLSTISLLMLVSGFALCEACGVEHKGLVLKLGALFPATGIFWPYVGVGYSKAYLAVILPAVAFTLLPIAYFTFFLMMNSRGLLGPHLPTGSRRVLWNVLMGAALLISGGASLWTAWQKQLGGFPVGRVALAVFAILVALGHFHMRWRNKQAAARIEIIPAR